MEGTLLPVSHKETCCLIVPMLRPNSSWFIPFDSLSATSLSRLNDHMIFPFGRCLQLLFSLVKLFF